LDNTDYVLEEVKWHRKVLGFRGKQKKSDTSKKYKKCIEANEKRHLGRVMLLPTA
jgi:hypothetical protein